MPDLRGLRLRALCSEEEDVGRLHEGRTRAVPGEGDPDTEVVFVGEGPGFNEDREGRPFVGRAGGLLVQLLGSIGGHAGHNAREFFHIHGIAADSKGNIFLGEVNNGQRYYKYAFKGYR